MEYPNMYSGDYRSITANLIHAGSIKSEHIMPVQDPFLCIYWSPYEKTYTTYGSNTGKRVSAANTRHAVEVAGYLGIVKDAKVLVINLRTLQATEFKQTSRKIPVTTYKTELVLEQIS